MMTMKQREEGKQSARKKKQQQQQQQQQHPQQRHRSVTVRGGESKKRQQRRRHRGPGIAITKASLRRRGGRRRKRDSKTPKQQQQQQQDHPKKRPRRKKNKRARANAAAVMGLEIAQKPVVAAAAAAAKMSSSSPSTSSMSSGLPDSRKGEFGVGKVVQAIYSDGMWYDVKVLNRLDFYNFEILWLKDSKTHKQPIKGHIAYYDLRPKTKEPKVNKKKPTTESRLERILWELRRMPCAWPFREPVDPQIAPDYHERIEHPVDLLTMRKRLKQGNVYHKDVRIFAADFQLLVSNCAEYNGLSSKITSLARRLRIKYRELMRHYFPRMRVELIESSYAKGNNTKRRMERMMKVFTTMMMLTPTWITTVIIVYFVIEEKSLIPQTTLKKTRVMTREELKEKYHDLEAKMHEDHLKALGIETSIFEVRSHVKSTVVDGGGEEGGKEGRKERMG
eukprot:jgi/Bigna1/144750/aug1.91_g19458